MGAEKFINAHCKFEVQRKKKCLIKPPRNINNVTGTWKYIGAYELLNEKVKNYLDRKDNGVQ